MKKQIALIAALILAGVMGYSWLAAHDAWLRFRAESQLKDQQIAEREKQAAAYRESIERLKKQTQTTPQIVRAIPKVVTLPVPASTEYRVPSTEWADLGTRYSQLGTTSPAVPSCAYRNRSSDSADHQKLSVALEPFPEAAALGRLPRRIALHLHVQKILLAARERAFHGLAVGEPVE